MVHGVCFCLHSSQTCSLISSRAGNANASWQKDMMIFFETWPKQRTGKLSYIHTLHWPVECSGGGSQFAKGEPQDSSNSWGIFAHPKSSVLSGVAQKMQIISQFLIDPSAGLQETMQSYLSKIGGLTHLDVPERTHRVLVPWEKKVFNSLCSRKGEATLNLSLELSGENHWKSDGSSMTQLFPVDQHVSHH